MQGIHSKEIQDYDDFWVYVWSTGNSSYHFINYISLVLQNIVMISVWQNSQSMFVSHCRTFIVP